MWEGGHDRKLMFDSQHGSLLCRLKGVGSVMAMGESQSLALLATGTATQRALALRVEVQGHELTILAI